MDIPPHVSKSVLVFLYVAPLFNIES